MTHITLGCRLMAGQRILVPSMGVRLPPSQPLCVVFCCFWPVRLAVQDAALSRRRSPVRIRYGLPRVSEALRASLHMARSSSGSGRRPLKAEITGSNPVRATKSYPRVFEPGVFFYIYAYLPVAICPLGGYLSSRWPSVLSLLLILARTLKLSMGFGRLTRLSVTDS